MEIHASSTALLLIDMQNDFLHPEGVFQRNQQLIPRSAQVTEELAALAFALREAGGCIISLQFSLISNLEGQIIIDEAIRQARPFLAKGDFDPGAWGHQLIDTIPPADFTVLHFSSSGFQMTHLHWLLRHLGIDTLLVGGLITNGSVASTARDAIELDYDLFVLSDGCTSLTDELHWQALQGLQAIATVLPCGKIIDAISED